MAARLRSGVFVSAWLRRCAVEGVPAVLRRRGAEEAGAVFVKIDRLDGTADLYGPAPQALVGEGVGDRLFVRLTGPGTTAADAEARLARQLRYDEDLWIAEADDAKGRHFLDLAEES